jgi:8-oxo-dGTP diphosphatase
MAVEDEPLLGEEGYRAEPAAALALLRELGATPGVTVACSQGGVVPDLVGALTTGARLPDLEPDDLHAKKGSTWLLTFGPDATLRAADYYERPTG